MSFGAKTMMMLALVIDARISRAFFPRHHLRSNNREQAKGSRYRSGRSPHWVKSKNPNAPAATREFEEDRK
jgi:hypothetical protein